MIKLPYILVPFEPVGQLQAVPINSTAALVTWQPVPEHMMNSPFVMHHVYTHGMLRNGTFVNFTHMVDGNTTSASIGGLFPFTEYNISVAACNEAGCNETSTLVLTNQTGEVKLNNY